MPKCDFSKFCNFKFVFHLLSFWKFLYYFKYNVFFKKDRKRVLILKFLSFILDAMSLEHVLICSFSEVITILVVF